MVYTPPSKTSSAGESLNVGEISKARFERQLVAKRERAAVKQTKATPTVKEVANPNAKNILSSEWESPYFKRNNNRMTLRFGIRHIKQSVRDPKAQEVLIQLAKEKAHINLKHGMKRNVLTKEDIVDIHVSAEKNQRDAATRQHVKSAGNYWNRLK